MARRERTTALPRPRPRLRQAQGRRFGRMDWTEDRLRLLVYAIGALAILGLVAAFATLLYSQQVGRPNQVVLRVGDQDARLSYYADRLLPWLRQNQSAGLTTNVLEDQLLAKIETELVTEILARERGITISDADINQGIGETLGIAAVSSGASFDALYRQKLKDDRISDANYRRMVRASVANTRLLDLFRGEVGTNGEQVRLRTIVITPDAAAGAGANEAARQKAQALLDQVRGGADMGTLAQTQSSDINTRQQDGLMLPEPEALLPTPVRDAVAGKNPGELLGPIQLQDSNGTAYWVVRIERREVVDYTEAQKGELAQQRLDAAIEQKRSSLTIKRQLDAQDVQWAEGQLN